MYSSKKIANYFIKKSIDTGTTMTPMKVLKLTYISHGWFMAYNQKPLISEAVLAWKYGPVIKSLYQSIKKYRNNQVTELIDINSNGEIDNNEYPNEDLQAVLEPVWDYYKQFSGLQLSTLTHQEGTPWSETINKSGVNSIIPNNLITKYYKAKIESEV